MTASTTAIVDPEEPTPRSLQARLEQARMMPTRRDGTMRKRVGFGTERARALNPLLSLVEDWMHAPGGYVEHLHRGFETVTLVLGGHVQCATSREQQVLAAGDVQWVTAGRGVLHAELPHGEAEAHMIQLSLNLPAAAKLCPPTCLTIRAAAIPTIERPGASVRVIAGDFEGVAGAATAASGARVLDLRLAPGAALELPIAAGQIGFVYVAEGALRIGAHAARAGDLVHCASQLAAGLPLVASEASFVVAVNAPPLDEPVVVHGPFVMNSAKQIQQAYAELAAGGFEEEGSHG